MKRKEYNKLHAEQYELVSDRTTQQREIDFWATNIKKAGEPALELGSGTGRVLISLLEQGLDVMGLDTSADMMDRCTRRCTSKNLQVTLFEQSMVEFDIPHEFGLIFLDSGGLGLFVSDQDIQATFERVMKHLKPGGHFIFEFQPLPLQGPDGTANRRNTWGGDWVSISDNTVLAWRGLYKYNPDTHIFNHLLILEKFIDGQLTETEANDREGRYFSIEEAIAFADSAGFKDIVVNDWLTEDPPNEDSQVITVHCTKPL